MSERLETKRCIKAIYKYSSFPFFFPYYNDNADFGHIKGPVTLHYIAVFIVAYSKKDLKKPPRRSNNVWVRLTKIKIYNREINRD